MYHFWGECERAPTYLPNCAAFVPTIRGDPPRGHPVSGATPPKVRRVRAHPFEDMVFIYHNGNNTPIDKQMQHTHFGNNTPSKAEYNIILL